MRHDDFLSFLKESSVRVFTTDYIAKTLGKSRRYAANFAGSSSKIEPIEKGKYCIKGTDADIVASHVVYPSYLSLASAFRFYNLTTQLPKEKCVITTRQHRNFDFRGYRIKFIKVDKKLLFGFENVNGVIVARPEKAFIDYIYIKKKMGYVEEFENALAIGKMDVDRLKKYAIMLGNRNLINRLGHFLDAHSICADDLLAHRSRNYVNMGKHGNKIDKKWRVIYSGGA
jgi:predicted transcriptional regulator of viral defense system